MMRHRMNCTVYIGRQCSCDMGSPAPSSTVFSTSGARSPECIREDVAYAVRGNARLNKPEWNNRGPSAIYSKPVVLPKWGDVC